MNNVMKSMGAIQFDAAKLTTKTHLESAHFKEEQLKMKQENSEGEGEADEAFNKRQRCEDITRTSVLTEKQASTI